MNTETPSPDSLGAATGSASWVKPAAATAGYYWRWDGDSKDTPTIVRVVEWQSGWLDGRDKPWRTSYLAECFGSMNTSWTMEELEMRGNMLLRIDAPQTPWPNAADQRPGHTGGLDCK